MISDKRIKFGSRLWYLGRQIHTLSELNGGLSKNRLRVYNKQIRRRRGNKRVLPLLLQERIFYVQNKWISVIFHRLSIQLFTCNLKLISDIDECVVDTLNNCSSDAFCNNTHGSFNCTCKPGFTGDEENCTGSIFSGMSVLVWQQKL